MRFAIRISLPVVLGVLVVASAGCTRAKPLPPTTPEAVVSDYTPRPIVTQAGTPGATVVSVGGPGSTPVGPEVEETATATAAYVATVAPPAESTPSAPASPQAQYTVAYGDTLFSISRKFGTTVQAIAQANNIPSNSLIRVGQVLTIPGDKPESGGEYIVQPGDTLFSIGARYGVTPNSIATANGIVNPSSLRVGQHLVIPEAGVAPTPGAERVYVVQPGDTLYRIALQYGKTVQALVVANKLPNANSIRVGQRLVIP